MPTGQSQLRNQVIYVQGQEEPKNPQFGLIVIYGHLNNLAVMNRKKNCRDRNSVQGMGAFTYKITKI